MHSCIATVPRPRSRKRPPIGSYRFTGDAGADLTPEQLAFGATMRRYMAKNRRPFPAWSEVLDVEVSGANDNFFALGGDSIRSLEVLALARERGLAFELQDLFRLRTLGPPGLKTGAPSAPLGAG